MRLQTLKPGFRLIAFALGLFALGLQYILVAPFGDALGLLTWTVNFFSFFTILSNTLAVAAMFAPEAAPRSALGRFFERPDVRTAIASYLTIVSAVYFFFLRNTWNPTGWQLVADSILHYLTPVLFLADWWLFVPRGQTSWRYPATSLAFPVAYIAWTFLHGALSDWYPYPFADVTTLGYATVLRNMAMMLVAFVAVALALKVVDGLGASSLRTRAD